MKEILHLLRHTKTWEIMGSTTKPQLLRRILTISPSKAVSPSLRTLAMAPESEKGTGANATTTASGSAPALGGANIRRLQVGGLLASLGLGMSGSMFFLLEKIIKCWKPTKNKRKKNMKITRIKHVFVVFLEASLPFWWGSKC